MYSPLMGRSAAPVLMQRIRPPPIGKPSAFRVFRAWWGHSHTASCTVEIFQTASLAFSRWSSPTKSFRSPSGEAIATLAMFSEVRSNVNISSSDSGRIPSPSAQKGSSSLGQPSSQTVLHWRSGIGSLNGVLPPGFFMGFEG
ncbi:hypothetical protein WJX84_009334 [Apatococcus fuscideae]|uniref:Uncharacterized protein n=1 Tax=Apatococcus fuscideae TaxID=2026836 RepID=A0AAW1THJ1_9CHLO